MIIIDEDFRIKKRRKKPGEIKDVKKEIDDRARQVLQLGVVNSVCVGGSGRGKVGGSHQKFSRGETNAEKRMRLVRAGSPPKLRQIASGSAEQSLWKRGRKVRS